MANKIILYLLLMICGSPLVKACDACGCSIGNTGNGLTTVFKKNFISLSYFGYSFNGALNQTLATKDGHYSITASARMSVAQKWYLVAAVPFKWNVRNALHNQYRLQGIGDVQLGIHNVLINGSLGSSAFYLDGGLSIKMPVSNFEPVLEDGNLPVNFNVGTGSWSPQLRLNAVYNYKQLGVLVSPSFQWSPKNSKSYQFGTQLAVQAAAFYQLRVGPSLGLTPYAGIYAEKIGRDTNASGKYEHGTGASGSYSIFGLNVKWKNFVMDASVFHPFQSTYAGGEVSAGSRWSLQTTYLF